MIAVLDFGAQYSQLIARRIRESKVYSEVLPYDTPSKKLVEGGYEGIVFSGGPSSVYSADAPILDKEILSLGIPVLGICYGMQLIAHLLEGEVARAERREFGKAELVIDDRETLLRQIDNSVVWMSHGDKVLRLPPGFKPIAHTVNSSLAAIEDKEKRIWGVQFHPEVVHTEEGAKILNNFIFRICGAQPSWTMKSFVDEAVKKIRKKVGSGSVYCGLSGGVDSSVTAALIDRAVGDQLTSIFVNTGLLRQDEEDEVVGFFRDKFLLNLDVVNAEELFLEELAGVTDPEEKRKIIGAEFVKVFQERAGKFEKGKFLAQGTLYPDVIESVSVKGPSATIKTHHNVGGLPDWLDREFLLEPLRDLFKDEVRLLGRELGLPQEIVGRHPFPGPGLAIRVIGEVTKDRLEVLRKADAIFLEEIRNAGLYDEISQALAILLPVKAVGIMGDERTYESVVALRAVTTKDFMTADWVRLPYEVLEKISGRITNEVRGVNRVVYDVSSKPPSTIEWE